MDENGVDDRLMFTPLQAKFHLTVFIVSASAGQKPHFGQILTFWGAPVPSPFYRWGPNLVCYSRPKVYTDRPNFIWMCSLCRLPVAKNIILGILWYWGLLYRPPFSDEGQIWCARADPRSRLTGQISSERVDVDVDVMKWRAQAKPSMPASYIPKYNYY